MEKGKLGIRLSFYAVAAFILAFLGYSTVLALLAGFVLHTEPIRGIWYKKSKMPKIPSTMLAKMHKKNVWIT